MLGKNNYNERLRKMEMQNKQEHFSIRKLSIGVASVLLGFTFFGLGTQTVKADTVIPDQQSDAAAAEKENVGKKSLTGGETEDAATTAQEVSSKQSQTDEKRDLSTYSGLSSFLKETKIKYGKSEAETAVDKKQIESADSHNGDDSEISDVPTNADQVADDGTKDPNANNSDNDQTDSTNSANHHEGDTQLPDHTVTPSQPENTSDKNQGKTTESDLDKEKIAQRSLKIVDGEVQVNNWADFVTAYQEPSVTQIDIMQDIVADKKGNHNNFRFPGRKLLIKSGDGLKHKIDFRGNHPYIQGKESLDLTYENLELWSADYYGVVRTNGLNKNQFANITFKDIDFHGSQLTYTSRNTNIFFDGKVTAETVKTPYFTDGPKDNNKQQILEFLDNDNSITFKSGSTFTGSTFGGTLIEMKGNNNVVTVEEGATVNLNPLKTYDGSNNANNGENGMPISAIYIKGAGSVNVAGTVNINIGHDIKLGYEGIRNAGQARAIFLGDKSASFRIKNGGTVNVVTNGNISDRDSQNLIYDGGDFKIEPNGKLKITGQDMGDYAGTLVQIDGQASIQNGAFEIELKDKAGTNAIKLVDVGKGGKLVINNPTSLILDAHLNKNDNTSIIGDNSITITNVRQVFSLNNVLHTSEASKADLLLPPFHVLQVKKDGAKIVVNQLELLNGKRIFDLDKLKKENPELEAKYNNLPKNIQTFLQSYTGKSYDELFIGIIEKVLSTKDSAGYNDIKLVPANPSGFLDIDTDPNSLKVETKEDGSKTISGRIKNYLPDYDGPSSNGDFQVILPGGSDAYIMASFKDSAKFKNGQAQIDRSIENPYADTVDEYRGENNDIAPLPTQFAAKVKADGTFSFTIPAAITTQMAKDATVTLTPHANFIDYSPIEIAKGKRPVTIGLGIKTLSELQMEAAQAITDAIKAARQKKPGNLTEEQNSEFEKQLANAAKYAANVSNENYESDKSVYGVKPSDAAVTEVNNRRKKALDIIRAASALAKNQGDYKQKQDQYIQKLKDEANNQITKFPSKANEITAKKDQAISKINSSEATAANIDTIFTDGIKAIDQVGIDYKNNVKDNIKQTITAIEKELANAAKDPNIDSAIASQVNGLKDRLQRPKEIVNDNGDIDQDTSEEQVKSHESEANKDLQSVKETIAAIKVLEEAAKQQIQQHNDDKSDIQDALNKAIKDIINSSNPKEDVNQGLDQINGTHVSKQRNQAEDELTKVADAARKRVEKSGLNENEQQSYLNTINEAFAAAIATTGDTGKSIYGSDDEKIITDRKNAAKSLMNKVAAKAELVGFYEEYAAILGDSAKANSALTQGQKEIDQIKDEGGNDQAINQAEQATKDNILNAFKEDARAQVSADADQAKNNLQVKDDKGIDDALEQAQTAISQHVSPTDIKNDITNGKNNILNAYQSAAKAKLSQVKDDVITQIQKNPNLSPNDKDKVSVDAAKMLNEKYDKQIDNSQSIEEVDQATKDGISALNDLLNEQEIKGQRNQAIAEIQKAHDNAKATIEADQNLTEEEKQKYQDLVNSAASQGIAAIETDVDDSTIETHKKQAIDQINGYLSNASDSSSSKLKEDRLTAIKELETAAEAAAAQIDAFDDTDLSPQAKQQYKQAINKDLDNARSIINSATNVNTIKSAKQIGKNNINKDLAAAQLSAAKSQAIKALLQERDQDLGIINQAYHENKLNDNQQKSLTNQINDFYNDAVNKVYQDLTSEKVAQDRDKGISAMASVANSISQEESKFFEEKKQTALNDEDNGLIALADKIRNEIENNANLSGNEKTGYYQEIESALNSAKNDIQNAQNVSELQTAANAGRESLNRIRDKALLQSTKNAALSELLSIYNEITEQISALENVNSTRKSALQQQLTNYYNDAVNRVKSAANDQIDNEKQTGIDNMQSVIRDAQSLDSNINHAKQELDQYAEQAINNINSSSLSDTNKANAIQEIKKINEEAKENIAAQSQSSEVTKAKNKGKEAIDQKVAEANANDLNMAKSNAAGTISQKADEAIKRLDNSYNSLTDGEKAEAKSEYEQAKSKIAQAVDNANSKFASAKNKDAIDRIFSEAITAINKGEAAGNLAITKTTSIKEIKQIAEEIKQKLQDQNNRDSVDSISSSAISAINNAYDSSTVIGIKDNAINQIKGIKETADSADAAKIKKAKEDAINALNEELWGNNSTEAGVLNQISAIDGLSDVDKSRYQEQAKTARDEAISRVNGQNTIPGIDSAKTSGIISIDQVLSDAQLHAAKNKAKDRLAQVTQTAVDRIDQSSLSDEEKEQQKELIKSNQVAANEKIENAQSTEAVEKAEKDGQDAINGTVENAEKNAQLLQEQAVAYNALVDQAKKLMQRLDQDLLNKKLDQAQYDTLTQKINDALKKAKSSISAATDLEGIKAAKATGQTTLNNISSEIDQEEALTKALNDLHQAAAVAKNKVNSTDDADMAAQMNAQIEQELKNAVIRTQSARASKPDTIAKINSAAKEGINTIEKLADDFDHKNQIVQELRKYAEQAKADLNTPDISSSDLIKGQKEIEQALNNGISSIYGADGPDLEQAEQTAKSKIDQAQLPTKLTAEKNRQINKFKEYVNKKGNIAEIGKDLDQDQINYLEQQREAAINKTIANISEVKLENSFEEAIQKVQNAEQGIAAENDKEVLNSGEKEIDRIYQVAAEMIEVVRTKQAAIAEIEKAKQDGQTDIENSGLSPLEKQRYHDQVQAIVDQAKSELESVSADATDAQEEITNKKQQKIKDIKGIREQAKLVGAKNQAEAILKNKQTNAKEVIAGSQLTAEQKQKAVEAIDQKYQDSKKKIEAAREIDEIPAADTIGQEIDQLLEKPTNGNQPEWFNDEQNNALQGAENIAGLQDAFAQLQDRLKDQLSDEVKQNIQKQIKAISNATNIAEASAAYDEGMTLVNKEKAKADIADEANKVIQEIAGNPSLSEEDKNKLKEQIKDDVQKAKVKIDAVNAPQGDTEGKKDRINQIRDTAKEDVASVGNIAQDKVTDDLKNQANNQLADKHQKLVNQLKEQFGAEADTSAVDKAYNKYAKITVDSAEAIASDTLTAEKEMAKGAIEDYANNVKKQVDQLKHQDGTDYTDTEKQVIRGQIAQEVAYANEQNVGKIDQATSTSKVDRTRQDVIDNINAILTPDSEELENLLNSNVKVQKERLNSAYNSAIKTLQDKFGQNVITTTLDKAHEQALNKLETADTDQVAATEIAGEKQLANAALKDAQAAAVKKVNALAQSDQNKAIIIAQIGQDLSKASTAINQAEVNGSSTITQLRDNAINQLYLDSSDEATIANIIQSSVTTDAGTSQQPIVTNNQIKNDHEISRGQDVILMHNAYLYDQSGTRTNQVIIGAGSVITVYGIKSINGRDYYLLVDQNNQNTHYYLATGNVKPSTRKLTHNAYVYNKHGKRVKQAGILRKNSDIQTYGAPVKIRGKKYYIIAANRFIKAANFAINKVALGTGQAGEEIITTSTSAVVKKEIMHNAYLYNEQGQRANQLILLAGSVVNTAGYKLINGRNFYELSNGLYVAAGNIDAQKLQLKRNAYVYSQHGNRLGRKVCHQGKKIKVYGAPISINHEKYYIIDHNRYIKKANFNI